MYKTLLNFHDFAVDFNKTSHFLGHVLLGPIIWVGWVVIVVVVVVVVVFYMFYWEISTVFGWFS